MANLVYLVREWAAYIPALFNLWLILALVVAAFRTRARRGLALLPLLVVYVSMANTMAEPFMHGERRVGTLEWIFFFFYFVMPVVLWFGVWYDVNRKEGYVSPLRLLLLAQPQTPPALDDKLLAGRALTMPAIAGPVIIAALLAAMAAAAGGLRPCGWLDVQVGPEGCMGIVPDYESVGSLAFTPDGSMLAVGHQIATDHGTASVVFWNMSDHKPVRTLDSRVKYLDELAFSQDGALMAVGAHERFIPVLNVSDGEVYQVLSLPQESHAVYDLAFTPDRERLIAGVEDNADVHWVYTWSLADGSLISRVASGSTACAVSPDGSTLAMVAADGTVELRPLKGDSPARKLEARLNGTSVLRYSPQGTYLAGTSYGGDVFLWRASDGTLLHEFYRFDSWPVDISFSHRESVLATGGREEDLVFWYTAFGDQFRSWHADPRGVRNFVFSPNEPLLASYGYRGDGIRLWRLVP